MYKVNFTDVEEFLTELKQDVQLFDRLLVRVSVLRRYHKSFITLVVLAATTIDNVIVELEHPIGTCYRDDKRSNKEFCDTAKGIMDRISDWAEQQHLEVRGGRILASVPVSPSI